MKKIRTREECIKAVVRKILAVYDNQADRDQVDETILNTLTDDEFYEYAYNNYNFSYDVISALR